VYSVYGLSGAVLYRDNITTGVATDYIRAGGMTIARLKTVSGSTTVSYLHQDHLGSPAAATDGTGAKLWRENYTPYGEERVDDPANDNDESFTGHIRDEDTGLIYAQARYMDPVIGRFLSGDPVGFSPGQPQMFNRYSYTLNDPVNAIDPTGDAAIAVGSRLALAAAFAAVDGPLPIGDVIAVGVLGVTAYVVLTDDNSSSGSSGEATETEPDAEIPTSGGNIASPPYENGTFEGNAGIIDDNAGERRGEIDAGPQPEIESEEQRSIREETEGLANAGDAINTVVGELIAQTDPTADIPE
jgi:RHS repeat-associated protein